MGPLLALASSISSQSHWQSCQQEKQDVTSRLDEKEASLLRDIDKVRTELERLRSPPFGCEGCTDESRKDDRDAFFMLTLFGLVVCCLTFPAFVFMLVTNQRAGKIRQLNSELHRLQHRHSEFGAADQSSYTS
jgi:hypothetical protein